MKDNTILVDEISKLKSQILKLEALCVTLEALVYVPGLWHCTICDFQLVQANLHIATGQMSAVSKDGGTCPNCDQPLERVTERKAGNDLVDRCEEYMERIIKLEAQLEGRGQQMH